MKKRNVKLAAMAACLAAWTMPVTTHAVDDYAFNQMLGAMAERDTGSVWFDEYVAHLNQELALKDGVEPFGAAGPNGPFDGFEGYIGTFRVPDTGSSWVNGYVDALNRIIQEKQQYLY